MRRVGGQTRRRIGERALRGALLRKTADFRCRNGGEQCPVLAVACIAKSFGWSFQTTCDFVHLLCYSSHRDDTRYVEDEPHISSREGDKFYSVDSRRVPQDHSEVCPRVTDEREKTSGSRALPCERVVVQCALRSPSSCDNGFWWSTL